MEDAFLVAALTGDLPELKELLRKGCTANAKNEVSLHTCLSTFRHGQAACFHSVEQSQ